MATSKQKKGEILKKVENAISEAKSLVFVNFHGLTVAGITDVRRTLKNAGVKYFVAKKSLIKLALGKSKAEGTIPELPGELALVWGEDLVGPAREIYAFQKKSPDNLKILGGIFEGKYMNQGSMMEIALIPALPVLHGMFVNIINSPIQRFVIGLNEIAKKKS